MSPDRAGPYALAASLAAHLAVVLVTGTIVRRASAEPPVAVHGTGDVAGTTFDIEGLDDEPGHAAPGARDAAEAEPAPPQTPAAETPSATPEPAPAPEPAPEPAPPPRKPRRKQAKAAAAGASGSAPATASGEPGQGGDGDGGGRRHGPTEGRDGDRMVARSFARVLPRVTSDNPRWVALPAGKVGTIEVTVRIDGEGKLLDAELDPNAPEILRNMIEGSIVLLRAGRFALTAAPGSAGTEKLRITVELHDGPLREKELLKHEWPTVDKPGKAYFAKRGSGRLFEATVAIVSSKAKPDEPAAAEP